MLKFVSPCELAQPYLERALASANFVDPTIQVSDGNYFIGHTTRQMINNLLDDEDISPHQYPSIFKAARDFTVPVAKYLLKWCPINDPLLKHANWIDFKSKFNHNFESVEYFVESFPQL